MCTAQCPSLIVWFFFFVCFGFLPRQIGRILRIVFFEKPTGSYRVTAENVGTLPILGGFFRQNSQTQRPNIFSRARNLKNTKNQNFQFEHIELDLYAIKMRSQGLILRLLYPLQSNLKEIVQCSRFGKISNLYVSGRTFGGSIPVCYNIFILQLCLFLV